jgi:predicted metal-dependent hydrolase
MSSRWQNAEEMRWVARDLATTMGIKITGIRVMPLKKKWGSMSLRGWMTLNSELLDLPKELGEYVIVHELVHQLAPNHGRVFKAFLTSYMPDWEAKHNLLQQHVVTDGKWLAEEIELSEEDELILDRVIDRVQKEVKGNVGH